jgi:hypothetical protein
MTPKLPSPIFERKTVRGILDNTLFTIQADAAAAGTTAVDGAGLDMAGFTGVCFIADIGALTATQVTNLSAQWSDTNNGTDWANFTSPVGGAVTPNMADADGNKLLILDVVAPMHRYLRPVLNRGTANAVLDGIIAIQYGPRNDPTSDPPASVSQATQINQPS